MVQGLLEATVLQPRQWEQPLEKPHGVAFGFFPLVPNCVCGKR